MKPMDAFVKDNTTLCPIYRIPVERDLARANARAPASAEAKIMSSPEPNLYAGLQDLYDSIF